MIDLRHGDCVDVMRTLPEASVDAVVTDPPYGLSFMGKGWDHGVPGVEFWAEAMRVAKPGAHLLAFGGTRTYHRLACAIEDAGWEIRDCVMWVYGSGFPKSLDVSKAIDKAAGAEPLPTGGFKRASIQRNGDGDAWKAGAFASHPEDTKRVEITLPATDAARQWSGWGTALKPAWEPVIVARKPLCGTVAENVLRHGTGGINVDACRIPSGDGRTGDGSTGDNGRGQTGGQRSRTGCTSGLAGHSPQPAPSSGLLASVPGCENQRTQPQDSPGDCPPCPRCGGVPVRPSQADGQASSQQPRDERELLCRCAIEPDNRERLSTYGKDTARHVESQGRWPANLIHDGSDEVVRLFPVTGASKAAARGGTNPNPMDWGNGRRDGDVVKGHDDNGGSAARFFYCAKASKADRDEGCEGLLQTIQQSVAHGDKRHGTLPYTNQPREIKPRPRGNHHPTVKPTELMRYLCRLVTPPGGLVLDPFMGSGSTGKAAVLEGFRFIGIEREMEYITIAEARIKAAVPELFR